MSVSLTTSHVTVVALRKESVDRNQYLSGVLDFGPGSLSARRAWIEILLNTQNRHLTKSLSARRAWIEIETLSSVVSCPLSLSARRAWIEIAH